MYLSHARYKLVTVISTLSEKATLLLQKNFGGVHSVISFWLATLLQMDLLVPYDKARHSAQAGTEVKVIHQIVNELLLEPSVRVW
jgi:hypothetical protein